MAWNCIGVLKPKGVSRTFSTPVFSGLDSEKYWAQRMSKDNVVQEMLEIPEQYLKGMDLVRGNSDVTCSIGHQGYYGFFFEYDTVKIAFRYDLEETLAELLISSELDAVSRLSVLRFLGCSAEEEASAIEAVGTLIENGNVREAFLALEMRFLATSEEVSTLDRLIEELSVASSFAQTRSIVARIMSLRSYFAPRQFRRAMRAALSNNQVYWISGDSDVKEFFDFLIERGQLRLSASALSKLER